MTENQYYEIINNLSLGIARYLKIVQGERVYPSSDPDKMDEIIEQNNRRADRLREIRNEIEDIYSGSYMIDKKPKINYGEIFKDINREEVI